MRYNKFMDYNQKLESVLVKYKKKCKCGHTKIVPPSRHYEYLICDWCGGRLYHDENKQKEHNKKVAKDNFLYNVRKFLSEENKMKKIDKKKLKKKCLKNSEEYFKFCNNDKIQIYIVETVTNSEKVIVYYGKKLGRPKRKQEYRRSIKPWTEKKYN